MPFGGLLTGGIGALTSGLAGLFGGKKQQTQNTNQTTTGSSTGTQSQTGNFNNAGATNFNQFGSSNPILNPLQQSLIHQFTQGAQNLWNQSTDLQPYAASQLEGINKNSNNASQAISANLAARGLAYSPAAAPAETQNVLNRIGQQNQVMQSIPLLQRQLQQQSLGQLMQAFQVQPYGTATSSGGGSTSSQSGNQSVQGQQSQNSTSNTQGTGTTSGNPMGGLFGGLGAGIMGMMPYLTNAFGGAAPPGFGQINTSTAGMGTP